jgi:hypothetical protein
MQALKRPKAPHSGVKLLVNLYLGSESLCRKICKRRQASFSALVRAFKQHQPRD